MQSVTRFFHPQRGGVAAQATILRLGKTRFWLRAAGAAAVAAGLAGCSPALDWRDVRLPDTALVTQLPCKPGRFPENPLKDMDCFNGSGEPEGDLTRLLWEPRRHLCFVRD